MTPTPRTDERANSWESTDGQWVSAEFARELERELTAKDAHADEIYKAAVNLAAKLEADLATERAQLAANHEATNLMGKWLERERELADRLAGELAGIAWLQAAIVPNPAELAVAAWKEARSGTV